MRFLHSMRAVDAHTVTQEAPWLEWELRSVGASEVGEPVGRFETLTCRACGHTAWYARDWSALRGASEERACPEACDQVTWIAVVEWYTKRPTKLRPNPAEGLHAIEGVTVVESTGRPYR
jgi:hypothetical protein